MFIGFRVKHWATPLIAVAGLGVMAIVRSDSGKIIAAAGKGAWKAGMEKLHQVREERKEREEAFRAYSNKP